MDSIEQILIDSISRYAAAKYKGQPAEDRLAFEVGVLRGTIRELAYTSGVIRTMSDQIQHFNRETSRLENT